ncbi:MAG TPA: hypothetical protein ENG62_02415 [Thermoplasmatales archaeon]|nr:hypothetical protein [Thermoplasmatales archaeon]
MSLLLSILGIAVLFFLSTLIQPILVSLEELSRYEGREVVVKGFVSHYTTWDEFQIIDLRSGNITTPIFLQGIVTVHSGDLIEVTGKVQKYEGKWEVFVDDTKDIVILSHWENSSTSLWEIACHPTWFEGLNINVTGYVESLHDKWFILSDGNYSILVSSRYIDSGVSNGDKVLVYGYFTYEPRYARYIIQVKNSFHRVIEI